MIKMQAVLAHFYFHLKCFYINENFLGAPPLKKCAWVCRLAKTQIITCPFCQLIAVNSELTDQL